MADSARELQIARVFVELGDTLADGFHLVDFLHVLTERVAELLPVPAAGVVMVDAQGRLVDVIATSGKAAGLEEMQVDFDEGPGRDCCRSGEAVAATALTTPQAQVRWPHFTPAARRAGFAVVAALPMRLRKQVIGALDLFHATPGVLGAAELDLGQALADAATIGILHRRAATDQAALLAQLQTALNSRVVIEQAKGMLAGQRNTTPEEAFALLRSWARSHQQRLTALCAQVVDGTAEAGLLAIPSPPRSAEHRRW